MIVLYGAGTIGGLIARQLKDKGEPPVCFADNDRAKVGGEHEGIAVVTPRAAKKNWPDATWVASVHRHPDIQKHIEEMGVKWVSIEEFLPARKDVPSHAVMNEICGLCADELSRDFLWDQYEFRTHGKSKMPPADIKDVYFEDFYTCLDNEHYVDCGAFDGDMVREFQKRWGKWGWITAYEPDRQNYAKMHNKFEPENLTMYPYAVSDHEHFVNFSADGDQTSHIIEGEGSVFAMPLDGHVLTPPTLIKMDIEGYEKEGLWGARNIIKEHSPVLAICAYHKGPDLWEIPLLIHALNPSYKLYFRRYLEATWELIWYAVPLERCK